MKASATPGSPQMDFYKTRNLTRKVSASKQSPYGRRRTLSTELQNKARLQRVLEVEDPPIIPKGFYAFKKPRGNVMKIWHRRWFVFPAENTGYGTVPSFVLRYWLSEKQMEANKPVRGTLELETFTVHKQGDAEHHGELAMTTRVKEGYLIRPESQEVLERLITAWQAHVQTAAPLAIACAIATSKDAVLAVAAYTKWDARAIGANASMELTIMSKPHHPNGAEDYAADTLVPYHTMDACQMMPVAAVKHVLQEATGVQMHTQQLFVVDDQPNGKREDELPDGTLLCEIGMELPPCLELVVMDQTELKLKELMHERRLSLARSMSLDSIKSSRKHKSHRRSRIARAASIEEEPSDESAAAASAAPKLDTFYCLQNKLVSKQSLADMYSSAGADEGSAAGGGKHHRRRTSLAVVEKFVARDAFETPYTKSEMRALAAVFLAHCDGREAPTSGIGAGAVQGSSDGGSSGRGGSGGSPVMTFPAFRQLFDVSEEHCAEVFALFDENQSGELDMKEFLKGFSMRRSTFDELKFNHLNDGGAGAPGLHKKEEVRF